MDFRLLRHLYYFLAVAEELHFGRAAQRLGITQPPLSAQIKVLEQVLGAELFERTNSGARLTQAGRAILPLVKSAVAQAGRLEGLVRAAKAGARSTITVGATNSAMFDPLGDAVGRARSELPNLTITPIEMQSTEVIEAVRRREVDIGLAWIKELPAPIAGFALSPRRMVLACRKDHPLAAKAHVSISDLAGEPMVMCDRRAGPDYADSISAACRNRGVTLQIAHEAPSISGQVAMVHCGGGVALLPETAMHYSGNFVSYRRFNEDIEVISLSVLWHSERDMTEVEGFLDVLRDY